jgi:hypothetical protein
MIPIVSNQHMYTLLSCIPNPSNILVEIVSS